MAETRLEITRDPAFLHRLGIPNVADRDDAAQDAFCKLWNRPITTPLLHTTLVNCHKDRKKGESRRRGRTKQRVLQRRDPGVVPATHRRRSQESYQFEYTWRDPRDRLYKREIRPGIIRAVRAAKLSPDCLCAIWAWVRGRVGEFARNRGVPESTVRVWVHRALKALRLHLEREGLGPD